MTLRDRAACWLTLLLLATPARAETVVIGYLALAPSRSVSQVTLDPPPAEEGVQGARLALADNRTTGRFLGLDFALQNVMAPDAAGVREAARAMVAAGTRLIVTDLPAPLLLDIVALAPQALLLDATSDDDALRGAACRAQVLHLLPSRAMLADGLMQFLAVKRWRNLFIVQGPDAADQAYADALRRSARKFQLKVVADKKWSFDAGAQRTDTGHVSIGAEVARFTQGLSYDVLVVADTQNAFGDDLAFRTTDPRPVAGTHGLVPTAWFARFEQWGATQLQMRFLKQAGRPMTARDQGAWMAVRAVGEAALRGQSADPGAIAAYLRGPRFELAAYRGTRLSFRAWDGQLRQPVLLTDGRGLVSVSPQPGFLHQSSELDTLGFDRPETPCAF